MRRSGVVLLAAVAAVSTSCSAPAASLAKPLSARTSVSVSSASATVTAKPVNPDPRIGAIFLGGRSVHTCTGSILHSVAGDLILTAAHCLANGVDTSFVPAFAKNAEPQQFWSIDAVYLDPRWVSVQNPLADFAVARVTRAGGDRVEAEAGGGFALGPSPAVGTNVTVTGYALGEGGDPIGCTALMSAREHGYPSLRCGGLVDGTSGAPWLAGKTVVGITGGLEGGGCQENVSYTSPFDGAVRQLLARAEAGGPGDEAPTAYDDC